MFNKNYILIESKIYFPPYYHVLKGLQHSSLIKKFPMSNYFIDAKVVRLLQFYYYRYIIMYFYKTYF